MFDKKSVAAASHILGAMVFAGAPVAKATAAVDDYVVAACADYRATHSTTQDKMKAEMAKLQAKADTLKTVLLKVVTDASLRYKTITDQEKAEKRSRRLATVNNNAVPVS